jgi:hypothetical protein
MWRDVHPDQPRCAAPTIPAPVLDADVWEAFAETLTRPGVIEAGVARLEAGADDLTGLESELASARAVLAAKERERNMLYDAWRRELADPDGDPHFRDRLQADYHAMREPVEAHQRAVKEVEARLKAAVPLPGAAESFLAKFTALRQRLAAGEEVPFAERWEALRVARARVVASTEGFDLYVDLLETGQAAPDPLEVKPNVTSEGSVRFGTLARVGGTLSDVLAEAG